MLISLLIHEMNNFIMCHFVVKFASLNPGSIATLKYLDDFFSVCYKGEQMLVISCLFSSASLVKEWHCFFFGTLFNVWGIKMDDVAVAESKQVCSKCLELRLCRASSMS